MPQLDSTWFLSQIFWLCICFGLLYFVVSKFLAPQMAEIAKKRAKKIDDYIAQAQSLKNEAEAVLSGYEKSVFEAKKKAEQEMLKQKAELEDLIDKKQVEANERIYKEIKKSEDNIKKIKDKAVAEIASTAKNLSKDIIKKLDL